MNEYKQSYSLNSTKEFTASTDQIYLVPKLGLTEISTNNLKLTGTVYNDTLDPINGALVSIYDSNTGQLVASEFTQNINNQDGSYFISFLGQYNIQYKVVASYNGYDSYTDFTTYTNTDTQKIFFILQPKSEVKTMYGKITNSAGQPIANAQVIVSDSTQAITIQTMSDGTYVAYDSFVSGSSYRVQASKVGYLENGVDVTFPSDSNFLQINLSLDDDNNNYTAISGKIYIEGSNPEKGLANAFVGLFAYTPESASSEILVATLLTDKNGNYTFTNVEGNKNYIIRSNNIIQIINT